MELNDLLSLKNIDPKDVIVMRHSPYEIELKKVLPWLAAEHPHLFNAYQSTHPERYESTLKGKKYVASFIGHEAGKALFIGLYEIKDSQFITIKEYWGITANQELKTHGMFGPKEDRSSCCLFSLQITDFYSEWKGKMIIKWPGGGRTYIRHADRDKNKMDIIAILEESHLNEAMPAGII